MSTTTKPRPAKKKAAPKKNAPKNTSKKNTAKKNSAAKKNTAKKKTAAKKTRVVAKKRAPRKSAAEIRRHRVRTAVALTAISVCAFASLSLIRSPLLDVEAVNVSGNIETSAQEIVQAAGIVLGTPLIEVDLNAVAAAVSRVPWVQSAEVSRSWRGSINVSVKERIGVLALPASNGFVLVDSAGRQLAVEPTIPDGFLPVEGLLASGIPGNPAPAGAADVLLLLDELTPTVRAAMQSVSIDRGSLSIGLVDGGRVLLGSAESLDDKVVSLETMLSSVDLRCLREIDLRVPAAPALSRIGQSGNPTDTLADLTECS